MKRILASIILMVSAMTGSATDFSAISIGQQVGDGKISFGQFNLTLPDGPWTVVGKLVASAGSQSGSSGGLAPVFPDTAYSQYSVGCSVSA